MASDLLNEIKNEISNRVPREDGGAYKIKERNLFERIRSNKKLKYLLIGLGAYILISYCHFLNKKKFAEDTLHQITVVEDKFKFLQTELSKIEEEIQNKIREYEREIRKSNLVSYENLKKIDVLEKRMHTLESLIENTLETYKSPNKNFKLENRIEKLEREYSKFKNLQKELEDLKRKVIFLEKYEIGEIPENYKLVVVEKDFEIPFDVSKSISKVVSEIRNNGNSQIEIAKNIYEWVERNVAYGSRKRNGVNYRSSQEVFKTREGVCGEMAYLYVTMARLAGLEAKWVEVFVDYKGEKVYHACAAVKINGKYILVDPAYHSFDIKHKKYKILSDKEAAEMFKGMRK